MDAMIDELVKILGAALATALIGLVVQLARKYGLQISDGQHAKLQGVAQEAILVIEEKASAMAKAQIGKLSAGAKLTAAVEMVVDKMPGVTREEAAEIVHAELPKVRAATAGFATAVLRSSTTQDGQ